VQYPPDSLREYVSVDFPTAGVVNGGDLAVVQHAGTPAMSVDVAAGFVMLKGILSSVTQGTYPYLKDALETKTIAAADPTNPRRDLVCAVVTDSVYAVDGTPNTQNIRVLTGTPAGSPVDPAIPGTWSAYQLLARVAVAANATSILNANITDLRTFCMPRPRAISTTLVGPPTTGTAAAGDESIDKWGALWRCVTGGTPGTWLWAGGGRYRATMTQTSFQSIPNSTSTVINFSVADDDPNSGITLGAASKYTCPVPGKYSVKFSVGWAAYNAAFYISVGAFKNGVEVRRGMTANANLSQNANTPAYSGAGDVVCAAGDTLDLRVFQSSGGAINTQGAASSTFFDVALVG
jgi:hypothetical protein